MKLVFPLLSGAFFLLVALIVFVYPAWFFSSDDVYTEDPIIKPNHVRDKYEPQLVLVSAMLSRLHFNVSTFPQPEPEFELVKTEEQGYIEKEQRDFSQRFRLSGTVMANTRLYALIEDYDNRKQISVSLGDMLGECEVTKIFVNEVDLLCANDRSEKILLNTTLQNAF